MNTKTFLLAALCGLATCAFSQQGLQGDYFNGQNFEQKVLTRTDPQINFVWDNVPPAAGIDPHVFSVRWTGFLQAPETGTYLFRAHVDDGVRVYIGGKLVIDAWDLHDSEQFVGKIQLNAGKHAFKVEYFNALVEGEIQLNWQLPSEEPVFGGLLGYNDHPISSRYLTPPASPTRTAHPPKATPQPQRVLTAETPPQKTETPSPVPVKKTPTKAIVDTDTLERYIPKNILFEKSKSIMLPASKPELDKLADFLQRTPRYSLVIEGHTDKIGNAAKNLELSRERAQTVASYLIEKGIAAERISAMGYGDTRPLIREAEGVANPKNRRVEFILQE